MSELDRNRIPKHVAIIMDGNGRWAQQRNESRVFGHMNGVDSVRATVEAAVKYGIRYLTLYAFSTENWSRPDDEVNALMDLLVQTILNESKDLFKQGVELRTIGDITGLPEHCQKSLKEARINSPDDTKLTLTLALNYSSKWEITDAIKSIVNDGKTSEEITPELIDTYLDSAFMPNPELMIRTSGESRLSNFMLWQLSYAEFYFTPVLWPDFREEHFVEAIVEYQKRYRRFGGISNK
jgi:undecaprenyl diphosphate synthase